jgi:hypothetical protein
MARIFVEIKNSIDTFYGDLFADEMSLDEANELVAYLCKGKEVISKITLKVGTPEELTLTIFNEEVLKTSVVSFSVLDN